MTKEETKTQTKGKKTMRWNVENLESNEEVQKEILQNMKDKGQSIDEPKTPYHLSDDDEIDYDQSPKMKDSINSEEENSPRYENRTDTVENNEWNNEEEISIDTSKVQAKPKKTFEQRRKEHYNEYHVMKKLLKDGKLKELE
mmetsp:Transcript_1651/g.2471  ORF Transcript_1651/g.2471 Transcript_1651/m.2471 type:complete len:142 (-) Transcript_1651:485-910(-)